MKKLLVIILFFLIVDCCFVLIYTTHLFNFAKIEQIQNSSYIAIFSHGIKENKPTQQTILRLQEGLKLYTYGLSDKIICTGYAATKMRNWLISKGVEGEKIIVAKSFDTFSNVFALKKVVGDDSVICVSEKLHLKRIKLSVQKNNMQAQYIGSKNPMSWIQMYQYAHIDFISCLLMKKLKPERYFHLIQVFRPQTDICIS